MTTKRLTAGELAAVKSKAAAMQTGDVQALAAELAAIRAAVDRPAVLRGGWSVVAMGGSGMAKVDKAGAWHVGMGGDGGRDVWGVGYQVAGGTSYWQQAGQVCGFHRGFADASRSVAEKERNLANGRDTIVPHTVRQYPAYIVPNDQVASLFDKLALAYACWVRAVDAQGQSDKANSIAPQASPVIAVSPNPVGLVNDSTIERSEAVLVTEEVRTENSDSLEQSSASKSDWPTPLHDLDKVRQQLDGELETRVEVLQRAEQSILRKALLRGSATGECALCGRIMDSRLLVAAHIKNRSHCSDSEKRDVANIVMLNCKFGCDELYEQGFICIDADWHIAGKSSLTDETTLRYIKDVVRSSIPPRPGSEKYFAWHRDHHNF